MAGVPAWQGDLISKAVLSHVLTEIHGETGVPAREVLSERKIKPIAHARQYAMWKLRKFTKNGHPRFGYQEIGFVFNRDHTTVMYGVRAHAARVASERSEEAA